ncbi:hypothetical protein Fot_28714 [Forsythia ovata]|uniref:Uncharacterized protein n=1 Tax=Forsythia ovata TaxID=205694 RepID=A0ABD1TQA3_9LAMI
MLHDFNALVDLYLPYARMMPSVYITRENNYEGPLIEDLRTSVERTLIKEPHIYSEGIPINDPRIVLSRSSKKPRIVREGYLIKRLRIVRTNISQASTNEHV